MFVVRLKRQMVCRTLGFALGSDSDSPQNLFDSPLFQVTIATTFASLLDYNKRVYLLNAIVVAQRSRQI
jgi:hypothetical protein